MTKAELIAVVAEKAGLSKKDADAAVSATFEAITETLVKVPYAYHCVTNRNLKY